VFHKKVFWTLVGIDAASAIADVQTSWHVEQTYPNSSEQNSWLYGQKPSLARYYATIALVDGGAIFLSYRLLHSRRRSFHIAGWILPTAAIAGHTEASIHNVRLHEATPLPSPEAP